MKQKKKGPACPPRTAVAYARYSSAGQRDVSIDQQLNDIRLFAAREGYTIVHEYADHARSGYKNARSRTAFQAMLASADSGTFDTVIVWKVDRFGRNREESAVNKGRLRRHGVKVVYAMEAIPEGAAGVLLEGMLESTAEWYSANLSENVKRGMYDNAAKCLYNGALIMGYCCGPDHHYQIVPEQAAIVRMVFNLYCDGMTITQICHHLNVSGLTTNRGKPFCYSRVWNILNNERYTGVYLFGDVRIPDGMPRIIDDHTWEVAHAMTNKSARHHETRTSDFLLTGKAFCGHCQKPMVGDSGTGKLGETYYYYTCQSKKRRAGCTKSSIRKEQLEDLVVNFLMDHCLTGEMMEAVAAAVIKAQQEALASSPVAAMEQELRDALRQQDNINNAIAEGIWNSSTKQKLDDLAATISSLQESITVIKYSQGKLTDHDSVIKYLQRFAAGDRQDPEHRRFLINTFLNSIYVYDDHLKVIINAVEGNSTIPRGPSACSDNNPDSLPEKASASSGGLLLIHGGFAVGHTQRIQTERTGSHET